MGAPEGLAHGAVGQGKVEQDQVNTAPAEAFQALGQGIDVFEVEGGPGGVGQIFAHQPRVAGIILDEKDSSRGMGRGGLHD